LILAAVVVVVLLGFIGYYFSVYNRFQSLKNAAEATLGQARVAMKKRLDMIEQLLGAVKSYAKFEKETLERVTAMRAEVFKAGAGSLGNIDRESRQILGNILAVAENYPELKTAGTVTSLMDSVKGIEDEIARHRYTYNNIVQEYNTKQDVVPSNFIARLMGLTKMEYLRVEEAAERAPRIEF